MFLHFDLRMYCLWGLSCIGAVSILRMVIPDFGFITQVIVGSVVGWAILTLYSEALSDISVDAVNKTLEYLDDKGYINSDNVLREVVNGAKNDNK